MIHQRFIKIIKELTTKELNEFDFFLHGFYSKQTIAIKLYEFILEFKPKFSDSKELSFQKAYEYVFNRYNIIEKKNRKNLLNSLSDLTQYLNEYLIWKRIKNNKEEKELLLLEIYEERKLKNLFINKYNLLKRKDNWTNYSSFRFEKIYYYSIYANKLSKEENSLDKAVDNLDLFFIGSKLKLACEQRSRQKILKFTEPIRLIENIITYVSTNLETLSLFHQAYYYAFLMINKEDTKAFQKLKYIIKQAKEIPFEDRQILLSYSLNFCSSQIRKGNEKFVREVFDLFVLGLTQQLMEENGYISKTRYNNIVDVACKLKEMKWVKGFVKKSDVLLRSEIKEHSLLLANAQIAFEEGKYKTVLNKLEELKHQDIFFAIRARWLLMCTYYEIDKTDEIKIIDECLKADSYFNKLTKVNVSIITASKKLSYFIKQLARYHSPDNKKSIQQLSKELEESELVFFRWWIKKKLIELE